MGFIAAFMEKMIVEPVHAVKFNQMSGEKVQMSGETKKDFAYTVELSHKDTVVESSSGKSRLLLTIIMH